MGVAITATLSISARWILASLVSDEEVGARFDGHTLGFLVVPDPRATRPQEQEAESGHHREKRSRTAAPPRLVFEARRRSFRKLRSKGRGTFDASVAEVGGIKVRNRDQWGVADAADQTTDRVASRVFESNVEVPERGLFGWGPGNQINCAGRFDFEESFRFEPQRVRATDAHSTTASDAGVQCMLILRGVVAYQSANRTKATANTKRGVSGR